MIMEPLSKLVANKNTDNTTQHSKLDANMFKNEGSTLATSSLVHYAM